MLEFLPELRITLREAIEDPFFFPVHREFQKKEKEMKRRKEMAAAAEAVKEVAQFMDENKGFETEATEQAKPSTSSADAVQNDAEAKPTNDQNDAAATEPCKTNNAASENVAEGQQATLTNGKVDPTQGETVPSSPTETKPRRRRRRPIRERPISEINPESVGASQAASADNRAANGAPSKASSYPDKTDPGATNVTSLTESSAVENAIASNSGTAEAATSNNDTVCKEKDAAVTEGEKTEGKDDVKTNDGGTEPVVDEAKATEKTATLDGEKSMNDGTTDLSKDKPSEAVATETTAPENQGDGVNVSEVTTADNPPGGQSKTFKTNVEVIFPGSSSGTEVDKQEDLAKQKDQAKADGASKDSEMSRKSVADSEVGSSVDGIPGEKADDSKNVDETPAISDTEIPPNEDEVPKVDDELPKDVATSSANLSSAGGAASDLNSSSSLSDAAPTTAEPDREDVVNKSGEKGKDEGGDASKSDQQIESVAQPPSSGSDPSTRMGNVIDTNSVIADGASAVLSLNSGQLVDADSDVPIVVDFGFDVNNTDNGSAVIENSQASGSDMVAEFQINIRDHEPSPKFKDVAVNVVEADFVIRDASDKVISPRRWVHVTDKSTQTDNVIIMRMASKISKGSESDVDFADAVGDIDNKEIESEVFKDAESDLVLAKPPSVNCATSPTPVSRPENSTLDPSKQTRSSARGH